MRAAAAPLERPDAAAVALQLCALLFWSACAGDIDGASASPPPMYDDAAELNALAQLDGARFRSFSSVELEPYSYPEFPHGNKDFNNFLAVCGQRAQLPWQHAQDATLCEPGRDGHLIAAGDGPGVLSRVFFTSGPDAAHARGRVLEERLVVYVDDVPTPLYDVPLASWQSGGEAPFVAPLVAWTSGAIVSYVAIPYRTKLRVLLDGLRDDSIYYYQVDLHERSDAEAEAAPELLRGEPFDVWVEHTIGSGAELPLLAREGAGTLERIELALEHVASEELAELDLRFEWDDSPEPAIDLPLATLFASSGELRSFRTRPMQVELAAETTRFRLSLPMPFETRASVSLRNRSARELRVEARSVGSTQLPAEPWGHLQAQVRESLGPYTPAQRFVAAELRGRGKLVGIIMTIEGRRQPERSPHPVSFLEGDPELRIDGEVAMRGTGVEDFFNSGWYFQDGPFDHPCTALTSLDFDAAVSTARLSAVRWMLDLNAAEYARELTLEFEYGAFEPLVAHQYHSVIFHYTDQAR